MGIAAPESIICVSKASIASERSSILKSFCIRLHRAVRTATARRLLGQRFQLMVVNMKLDGCKIKSLA